MANKSLSRRRFIKTAAATAAGVSILPSVTIGSGIMSKPLTRTFGSLDFEVTTMGLGGQASLQWTPDDVDPVKIILKAYEMGINYFDTSNLYGPSQMNYGKAFRHLGLVPREPGFREARRRSVFLTSKTHLRYAKANKIPENMSEWTNGPQGSRTVDDLKRTLSQTFGDGKGNYPKGAYLDMALIHSLSQMEEVDILYEGLENTDPAAETIGALAALRDYKDGSNLTGLNPGEEKLIRHIGFSGHHSPAVMMEMIQRDEGNLLEGMLIAVNPNDLLNFNMQYNVIPVAAAKNMGVIAMKVFADGALYSKGAHWSSEPAHVVRTIGSAALPSQPLIRYALTTPGVHTAIIGIGQISDNHELCQLSRNLAAAQVEPDSMSPSERRQLEKLTAKIKEGRTNYFQLPGNELTAPRHAKLVKTNDRLEITWDTAYAGNAPVKHYEIWRDGKKIGIMDHRPQTGKKPFSYIIKDPDSAVRKYQVYAIDAAGRSVATAEFT